MTPDVRRRVEGRRTLFDLHVDGVPVSHAVVHDLVMWIQGVRVRAGGVGGVSTLAEHRGEGHAQTLLEAVIRDMIGQGYVVSLLFGIPDYYDRLGYTPFMAFWSVRVSLGDALLAAGRAGPPVVRPVAAGDHGRIVDWYNELARPRGAAMARDRATFPGYTWGTYKAGRGVAYLVEGAGYFVAREDADRLAVIEAGCPDGRFHPVLLGGLAAEARVRACDEITLEIPSDDPFARYLTGCGCRVEARYPRMSDGMIRILDPSALFACLGDTIQRKHERGSHGSRRVVLPAGIEIGPAGAPAIHVGSLSASSLAQLVTGYRLAEDLVGGGAPAEALDTLFAAKAPYVWQADRF